MPAHGVCGVSTRWYHVYSMNQRMYWRYNVALPCYASVYSRQVAQASTYSLVFSRTSQILQRQTCESKASHKQRPPPDCFSGPTKPSDPVSQSVILGLLCSGGGLRKIFKEKVFYAGGGRRFACPSKYKQVTTGI